MRPKTARLLERKAAQRGALRKASLTLKLRSIASISDAPDNTADILSWAAMLYARLRDIQAIAGGSSGRRP